MIIEKKKLYEDREDVTLTSYILDETEKLLSGAKRPAVLICPGGGYMKCATQEGEPIALHFASMGYHAFVLRYSTYFSMNPEGPYPKSKEEIELREHCVYPAPIREIGQAMLLIREYAQKYNIDTDKIVLCGGSAGAHNVAMYAENWDKSVITDHFKEKAEKFKPAALILSYIAGDLYFDEKPDLSTEAGRERDLFFRVSYMAIAGKQELTQEDKDIFAVSKNVTESVPPTFLWATSTDHTVSVKNTLMMAHSLAEHNIPFECHVFEEGHHGLALATQATAKVTAQIRPDVAVWMDMADTWMQRRFALDVPENI